MASLNRVILMGNLTRDIELRYTQSGQPIARFGIAINRTHITDTGQKKEEVDFIPITVWGKQAELCEQYLTKGQLVLVDGQLRHSSWETKEGKKRSAIEVVARQVQFLSSKTQKTDVAKDEEEDEEEEKIPF